MLSLIRRSGPKVEVKVTYNTTRGYHLVIPNTVNPLPDIFVQAVLNKKTISCSTAEIMGLSHRAAESIHQALTITNEIIQELVTKTILPSMDRLFSFADSVVRTINGNQNLLN